MSATRRQHILELIGKEPRSVSSLALAMGMRRGEVADDLEHAIRSARATGARIRILPASCRSCGFTFGPEKLMKPGKCPKCRGTRILEAQISLEP